MMLGTMDSGYISIDANSYFSYPYFAPFVQDDWKVTTKLTVNLGVRWDLQGPPSEANNKMLGDLDTTTPNPATAELTTALPNGSQSGGRPNLCGDQRPALARSSTRTLVTFSRASVLPTR